MSAADISMPLGRDLFAAAIQQLNDSQQGLAFTSENTPAIAIANSSRLGSGLFEKNLLDFVLTTSDLQLRGVSVSEDEIQRTLRSPAFIEEVDRLREEIRQEIDFDGTMALSAASATFGVSLLYLLWLIRGGVLMGSYLSALPAWKVLDPLPVLERMDESNQEDDELVDGTGNAPDDAAASLRGY